LKLDSYFTISERIMQEDKRDLLKEMLKSRRFLFETDITQYYVSDGEVNPLLRLESLIRQVAELFKLDPAILQRLQAANYQLLTGHSI
ncbi:MAG TPA: TatD family deoxyribonuclease, partial [Candidatus Cloacimonadota bacterium]|nr:TatD family deoxyribonuclease [Candidatus Cloacimonadota bacterium]